MNKSQELPAAIQSTDKARGTEEWRKEKAEKKGIRKGKREKKDSSSL